MIQDKGKLISTSFVTLQLHFLYSFFILFSVLTLTDAKPTRSTNISVDVIGCNKLITVKFLARSLAIFTVHVDNAIKRGSIEIWPKSVAVEATN